MIIYNKVIPFGSYLAMTLGEFIFAKRPLNDIEIQHEKIHVSQYRELLYIGFLLWYLVEFIILLFKYCNWNMAYRNISLEKEAYAQQGTVDYLKNRKHYAFLSYL